MRNSLYKPGKRPSSFDSRTCRASVLKKGECWQKLIEAGKLNDDLFTGMQLKIRCWRFGVKV